MDDQVQKLIMSFVEQTRRISAAQERIIAGFESRAKSLSDSMVKLQLIAALIEKARAQGAAEAKDVAAQAAVHAREVLRELKASWKTVQQYKGQAEEISKTSAAERGMLVSEQSMFIRELSDLRALVGRVPLTKQVKATIMQRLDEFDNATQELEDEKDLSRRLDSIITRHDVRIRQQSMVVARLMRILETISSVPFRNAGNGRPIESVLRTTVQELRQSLSDEKKEDLLPMEGILRQKISAQQKVASLIRREGSTSLRRRIGHALQSLTILGSSTRITRSQAKGAFDSLVFPSEKLDFVAGMLAHPELLANDAVKYLGSMIPLVSGRSGQDSQLDPLFAPLRLQVFRKDVWVRMVDNELRDVKRTNRPVALLVLDINFFKKINDLHGHQAGDLALRDFGQILVHNAREHEPVGRYGGEEFVVLLRDADVEAARRAAERIRDLVERHEMKYQAPQAHSVTHVNFTVSVGVASTVEMSHTFIEDSSIAEIREMLINMADRRMYVAKKFGRNRVEATVPLLAGTLVA